MNKNRNKKIAQIGRKGGGERERESNILDKCMLHIYFESSVI